MVVRAVLLLGLCLTAAACQTLTGSGLSRPTVEAELTALADEATAIATSGIANGTQIARTVQAAETSAANLQGINRQLVVTLRALIPPTQQIVTLSGAVTPGYNEPLPGQTPVAVGPTAPTPPTLPAEVAPGGANQFTQITTAAAINASDGCAASPQTTFSTTASRIYATARVLNITAGTRVFVEWRYNGQTVATSVTYTVPQNDPDFCLWFYLEPTDVPFQAGTWSAQFFVNSSPVTPVAEFTMN
ncbi:MAG: hypothetical protein ACUVS2_09330 [Candidatus Flexifilum sp.]